MPKRSIVVVGNGHSGLEAVCKELRHEGFEVERAKDTYSGAYQAQLSVPDVLLVDVATDSREEMRVCQQLRRHPQNRVLPIIVMLVPGHTERSPEEGLDVADVVIEKPLEPTPLAYRVKTVIQQSEVEGKIVDVLQRQGIQIDRLQHRVTLDGEELQLTPTEFRILWTLLRQPGRAFTRRELIRASLGAEATITERNIDVHVTALRRKLWGRQRIIETVRGVGYRARA